MSKIDLTSINKKYVKPDPPSNTHIKKPIQQPKPKKDVFPKKMDKAIVKAPKKEIPQAALSDLDRSKKIKLLELYVMEFPDDLAKYKSYKFNKCDDAKLIELKKEFDKSVCSKNNLHWGVSVSQQALQIYELLCKMGGLDVDGIAKLGYNEEWIKNVKAICLKYLDGGITMVEPEHQLLFMLFQNTMTLHYLNTSTPKKDDAITSSKNSEIDENKMSSTEIKLTMNSLNRDFEDL